MHKLQLTICVALFAIGVAAQASESAVKVGSCPIGDEQHVSAQFTSIQAAVNAAAPGSEVMVCPGTYPEQVEITKPLTLKGVRSSNMGAAVIVPPPGGLIVPLSKATASAPQVFAHDIEGEVNISNLTVDASNNQITNCVSPVFIIGVYLLNVAGSIENVATRNQNTVATSACGNGVGLRVYGSTIPSQVTVRNNTASTYDSMGLLAQGTVGTVLIDHNSFVELPGSAGIVVFDDVITTVSENAVSGNANAFSGIAVVGVHNAVITDNHVGGDLYGITLYTLTGDPNSDGNTISDNEIFGNGADGIAVCGDNNLIHGNIVSGSTESGVNLVTGATFGAQCTSDNNRVADNRINGACTGFLLDPAASGNTIGDDNRIFNSVNLQLDGTTCTFPATSKLKSVHNTAPRSTRLRIR